MSNPDPIPIYSVDSSSFMDWQARFYPTDVFMGLVQRVETLIADGRFRAPALVREEIEAVGTAGLIQWVQDQTDVFVPTAEVLADAQTIQNQFPGLRDPKAEYEEADAYVIALARLRSGIVVTQETSAAEKRNPKRTHFIPDVCRELGVPCISLIDTTRGLEFLVNTSRNRGMLPNGATLSADPMTTQVGSPDGAQRNPGIDGVADRFPRYFLRLMLFRRRILGHKCLR